MGAVVRCSPSPAGLLDEQSSSPGFLLASVVSVELLLRLSRNLKQQKSSIKTTCAALSAELRAVK